MKDEEDVINNINTPNMFYSIEELEAHSNNIRKNATPKQLAVMQAVDHAFSHEVNKLDSSLYEEERLRQRTADLLGVALGSVRVNTVETIQDLIPKAPENQVFQIKGYPSFLFKNALGVVTKADHYIQALENELIVKNSQFTSLGFWSTIGLAFKNLFKSVKERYF